MWGLFGGGGGVLGGLSFKDILLGVILWNKFSLSDDKLNFSV